MKLKIINNTSTPTDELRKLTKLVMKHKGIDGDVEVQFGKARKEYATGYAYYKEVWYVGSDRRNHLEGARKLVKIGLPTEWQADMIDVLQTMAHEFDHTLGLKHADMCDWWNIDVSEMLYEWEKGE